MRAKIGGRKKAYSTPIIITDKNGREQLIALGAQWLVSYDLASGDELWRLDHGDGFSVIPRPVYSESLGLLYFSSGYLKPVLWAIDPTGDGDITADEALVAWQQTKRISARPSLLLADGSIYSLTDAGIANCFDAASGEVHWTERIGGNFSASPLLVGDKIYLLSHEGEVIVIKASREFQRLSDSQLE